MISQQRQTFLLNELHLVGGVRWDGLQDRGGTMQQPFLLAVLLQNGQQRNGSTKRQKLRLYSPNKQTNPSSLVKKDSKNNSTQKSQKNTQKMQYKRFKKKPKKSGETKP